MSLWKVIRYRGVTNNFPKIFQNLMVNTWSDTFNYGSFSLTCSWPNKVLRVFEISTNTGTRDFRSMSQGGWATPLVLLMSMGYDDHLSRKQLVCSIASYFTGKNNNKITCRAYCSILIGPSATRMPSTASINAWTRCGEVSKMLGHTWLSRCTRASSHPNPNTPRAMCFIAAHAVCRWTRSLWD